jgi:hypothetical protein
MPTKNNLHLRVAEDVWKGSHYFAGLRGIKEFTRCFTFAWVKIIIKWSPLAVQSMVRLSALSTQYNLGYHILSAQLKIALGIGYNNILSAFQEFL